MFNNDPDQEHLTSEAQSIFSAVIQNSNLSAKPVAGWGGATLQDFNNSAGWLGLWMFKSELRSMSLIGKRMWSVAYQATDQSAEGVAPVDFSDAQMSAEVSNSYLRVPVATDRDLPVSLRYLIARAGLFASIESIDHQYHSVPIRMHSQKALQNGEFLPFPDQTECLGAMLSQFTLESHLQLEMVRARRMQDAALGMSR